MKEAEPVLLVVIIAVLKMIISTDQEAGLPVTKELAEAELAVMWIVRMPEAGVTIVMKE